MNKAHHITVAVCTYQRDALLEKCLVGLRAQTIPTSNFSVLVIDNADSVTCKALCDKFNVSYVAELTTGLSHARNRAIQEISHGWILYLDDDGIARPTLIQELSEIIKDNTCQIVGGKYCHYFDTPPPQWLKLYYKNCKQAIDSTTLCELPEQHYLSGGIFAFKLSVFNEIGNFNTELGMTGTSYGYGEDDEVQDRARGHNIPVHFSPDLVMDHLVSPRKYTITSRIKMAYAHGIAWTNLKDNSTYSFLDLLKVFLNITFKTIPYDIARWLFKPGFYWQNALVSTTTKYANALGKYRTRVVN